ncbi:IS1634 family transposase [Paeniglutamicibacter cryotolerans]|uniref:Transposase n=3 Tax=Paeniglutamicibacter cryotolerans TaxID=670079 RepID=A0A839QLM6_9MICC|nr:transposase [Paeniglutamicibacter cryotolerans]MBB2995384.1 transposase [Paeniglutamicibacter cryotolerans]MBB2995471.1 transposase [Paeniglutamicibacter cryotolerans]MBB2995802.1 transposase [Paeniglutamicibacter cryotolerans]
MALYKKTINGNVYWYLREMARVDGKPKMVSERYLGSAKDIEKLLDAKEAATVPEKTRHLGFGDSAAVWGILQRLDIAGIIDEAVGPRRTDAGASVGTYLSLAALNRVVAPTSKAGFSDWWKTTAADRFTKIPASVLDHRRFWDAMHKVTLEQLAVIEERIALAMITEFNLDISALALDMTNFATYIDSTNEKAPIAQRGKAKQKRNDLRLVGLGLVITRDGGIPLLAHAYPGNKPDVTQFPLMIDALGARHRKLAETAGISGNPEVTVVFDAGQNSASNFTRVTDTDLAFVGSIPPSQVTDLLKIPAKDRVIMEEERFEGLSAVESRRDVYGTERRVILTHSPTLHQKQAAGFAQTLAKAQAKLADLAETLARGKARRTTGELAEHIKSITRDSWLQRVLLCEVTGTTPATHRLSVSVNETARKELEDEVFGKRILVTTHENWPVAEVVDAYRSQSDAEFGFRQLKDPHVVSFSPMNHWTEHNIRIHTFTCVLALQIAHLMRRDVEQAGEHHSVRELLERLASIGETVMIYPSTGGRPKARRMLTEEIDTHANLAEIFNLAKLAPKKS